MMEIESGTGIGTGMEESGRSVDRERWA